MSFFFSLILKQNIHLKHPQSITSFTKFTSTMFNLNFKIVIVAVTQYKMQAPPSLVVANFVRLKMN